MKNMCHVRSVNVDLWSETISVLSTAQYICIISIIIVISCYYCLAIFNKPPACLWHDEL